MSCSGSSPDASSRLSSSRRRSHPAFIVLVAQVSLFCATSAFAGSLKITSTTFGWNPATGTTTAGGLGPLGQFPAMPLNQPIEIVFDDDLDKASVDLATATVTTVPADVLTPLGATSSLPGGLVAPVNYSVKGSKLTVTPALYFTGGTVNFGYVPGAFYYLRFAKGGLQGKGGDSIGKTILIGFRTTEQILDMASGPPRQTIKLLDPEKGGVTLGTTDPLDPKPKFDKASASPPPRVRFRFNEVVLTSTIVNPATGISPTLRIELDADDDGTTVADRVLLPGRFNVVQSQKRTRVDWSPFLAAIPPDRLYLITVEPLIEDLLGNSLFEQTGDIGAKRVYAFRTKPGGGLELPPIVEEFDNGDNKDVNATSADWAVSQPGFLINGVAGGTGIDGAFMPASSTTISTSVFDSDLNKNVPRVYDFTKVEIPAGVSVRAVGEFGLKIRATGAVTVNGVLDCAGSDGELFNPVRIAPGLPGVGVGAGGSGGQGGSVTDGINTGTSFFTSPITGYGAATQANQGLTGLSAALTTFTMDRSGGTPFTPGLVGLWLQPNCGTGSTVAGATPGAAIQHNHPTFQIDQVVTNAQLHVDNQFGPLNQPGLDLYEFPAPPIAKVGDPFLVGDLAGHAGTPVGFAGAFGRPSLPVSVAQTFLTQARSGGGGGGGSKSAGSAGESAPVVGTQSGTVGGTGGSGYLIGMVASKTATTLTVSGTPFTGLDLNGGPDPNTEPPFVLVPDVATSFVFEITSNTANTVTIHAIGLSRDTDADTNNDEVLDLDDVPGLGGGDTFRVEPPHALGGGGGGGSGVHCANTTKLTPPPSLTLPKWTPGAGGGAGGGSIVIESAGTISVGASGKILADGGDGGETNDLISTSASGGGGGAGGTIVLRSASPSAFAVTVAGAADASGGAGGVGFVDGGAGGDGRIRFENVAGNLVPANFTLVTPAPSAPDLGYLIPGLSQTAGQSEFLASGTLTANYLSYTVRYSAKVDGVLQTGLEFTFADFQSGDEAPFEILFNDAGLTGSGEVDPGSIDNIFVEDLSSLHQSFLRFRIVIEPSKVILGATYEAVQIDRVEIHYNQA